MLFRALFGSRGPSCDVNALYQKLQAEPCTLLDVREPSEFRAGHVPGAVNVPLGELASGTARFEKSTPVHVICLSGGRSQAAQKQLQSLGFEEVINVEGGFRAWTAARLPAKRRSC